MKTYLFVLPLLLSVLFVTAQSLQPGQPASAGFSPQRLQRIDSFLQQAIHNGWTNAAAAMIVRNGKIIYNKTFGYDDTEQKIPAKKDGIYRIASQTKAITSVAVMMLYEEGKLLLDDPISKYIPAFRSPKVINQFRMKDTTWTTIPATREITIRDLLTHTSGIGYAQIGSPEAVAMYHKAGIIGGIGIKDRLLADKMNKLGALPLLHQPGTKWTYGLNTDVLGYLVEVVSGMRLDDFFRQRIFDPLGMQDTYFYLPENKQSRLVSLYTEREGKIAKMDREIDLHGTRFITNYPNLAGTYLSGGGGLSSTMYDYAVFLQMLINGGEYNGVRLLGRNTVRMMIMNQLGDLSTGWRNPNYFGLGFMVTSARGSSILPTPEGVFEWAGMFATTYWADPKEKIVALLYQNIWPTSYGMDLANRYKVLVYQALTD